MDDSQIAESRTSPLRRGAALIAGVAILYWAAKATIGLALVAPIGVWAVIRFKRGRGRSVDALGSWMGAVGAVMIVLIVIGGVLASMAPAGTMDRVRHSADSSSALAAKRPPPAWLERFAPEAAARAAAQQPGNALAFNAFALILGAAIVIGFGGSTIGTIGWIGTMLLMFSVSGRWPGKSSAIAIAEN
jgi:hypothetical protein